MSKQIRIESIKHVMMDSKRQKYMSIFIHANRDDVPEYFDRIRWDQDIDVYVPSPSNAESLIKFTTS